MVPVHWEEQGGGELRCWWDKIMGSIFNRTKWEWRWSDHGDGEGWSKVLAAAQVRELQRWVSLGPCLPAVEVIPPTHFRKQHSPAKLPSSLCHDNRNAHPPGLCLEDWSDPPHPHIADPSCWSQNSLNSGPMKAVALISGLEAFYQLPNSSTERAPHSWCCMMLVSLWLNKCSYEPWNPHPRAHLEVTFCSNSTLCLWALYTGWGFCFFFSPLGQKCVSGRQIVPRQDCSPTPPFAHSLPKDIKAVCKRLSVVKIEVWQSLQSHWISKETPFDYLSFSIYPYWEWVDSHTWVSFNHSAALYLWLL